VKKKKCEKKIIIENLRIGVKTNEIIIQRRKNSFAKNNKDLGSKFSPT
jgi:hypothetical protein